MNHIVPQSRNVPNYGNTINPLSSQSPPDNRKLNCPSCGSINFEIVEAPSPHDQKLICSKCQRFIKWLSSPQTANRHNEIKKHLEALQGKVSGWNSTFINDLLKQYRIAERDGKAIKLSPRQLTKLAEIEAFAVIGGDAR